MGTYLSGSCAGFPSGAKSWQALCLVFAVAFDLCITLTQSPALLCTQLIDESRLS